MGRALECFQNLSKLQSESYTFFSDARYETVSADFKINTATLAEVVSILFTYLKPEIESKIKQLEAEISGHPTTTPGEMATATSKASVSTLMGVPETSGSQVTTSNLFECPGIPGPGGEEASGVSATPQDVSISAQPGRDSPIAVPMTAATSSAVQDDILHITIIRDEETELTWENAPEQIQLQGTDGESKGSTS